jgi:hypothetical protein
MSSPSTPPQWRREPCSPPVVLFRDGEQHWIGDGYHRIAAAQRVGFTSIRAEVREGDQRDARLYAASANQTHGLRRTNADKRLAVLILLQDEEWGQWSDRAIARHCGVSPTFVGSLRASLSTVDSENGQRIYTTKHGTMATMDTTQIGSREAMTALTNRTSADDHQAEVMPPVDLPAMAEMPPPTPEGRTSEGYGRQTVRDLYGQEGEIPPPPKERPHAMEESLGDLHSRVLVYLQAVEQKGGIKRMAQDWTQERKQDFMRRVAEILAKWTGFAGELQDAYPQVPLALLKGTDA